MTTKDSTANNYQIISPTRRRVMGIIFLSFAGLIWFLFARTVPAGVETTFRLVPGGSDQQISNWVFTSLPVLNILAGVSLCLGGYQLARGFKKRTNQTNEKC